MRKRIRQKAHEKCAEGYIDTGIIALIAVIVGALMLAGMNYIMDNVIVPNSGSKIVNMFAAGEVEAGSDGTEPGSGDPEVSVATISVISNPSKMVYEVGEKISLSGIKVMVTYSDNSTNIIGPGRLAISPDTAQNSGPLNVSISYTEDDVVKTTSIQVTVN